MNPFEPLQSFLPYVVALVPMLGILIFVHELGHFLVAKYFGVRVLRFSLGFGSPIGIGSMRMRWERGGTEYVIAWIPLGGYVKMLGEQLHDAGEGEPPVPDARPDEFLDAKPVWQKLCITFAGPAMNLLLPVFIFAGVFAWGLPRGEPIIGTVEAGSPAAAAGLRAGDRVLAVDGEPVAWWMDVETQIRAKAAGRIDFEIERDGRVFDAPVERSSREGLDAFGSPASVGWVGFDHRRLPALVGVPARDSLAARAGLRSGDVVRTVQGEPVEDWEGLRRALEGAERAGRSTVDIRIARGSEGEEVSLEVPAKADLAGWGVMAATLLVGEVSPGLPAERAGVKRGDLILKVDGEVVGSFGSFADIVRTSRGRPLAVTLAREGDIQTLEMRPE